MTKKYGNNNDSDVNEHREHIRVHTVKSWPSAASLLWEIQNMRPLLPAHHFCYFTRRSYSSNKGKWKHWMQSYSIKHFLRNLGVCILYPWRLFSPILNFHSWPSKSWMTCLVPAPSVQVLSHIFHCWGGGGRWLVILWHWASSIYTSWTGAAFVFLGDQLEALPSGPRSLGRMFVFRVPGGLRATRDCPNHFFWAPGSRHRGVHASAAILS